MAKNVIWWPPPSWILWDINFAGKTSYGTAFSISVSNLVRICSIMAELLVQPTYEIWWKYMQKWTSYGQKCDFQYGGRRHFGFCDISLLHL